MPPAPMAAWISYGPRRVPGESVIGSSFLLVRRHLGLQLLEPVEDDVHLAGRGLQRCVGGTRVQVDKAPTVDAVVAAQRRRGVATGKLDNLSRLTELDRGADDAQRADKEARSGLPLAAVQVEQLPAVR